LFGSRTDDDARGGDIDLLILTRDRLYNSEKSSIELSNGYKFGHQRIDFACFSEEEDHPFKAVTMLKAIEL